MWIQAMRNGRTLAACSVFAMCIGTIAIAGPVGIVDDFTTEGLGEYTLTRILDNGVAESNVVFSDVGGSLSATYTGTVNQAEQVVFLRADKTLAVGETLLVNVAQPVATAQMDFGIVASATATPTGVGNPTPIDTRTGFDWLSVSVRPSQNAVRTNSAVNGVLTTATGVLGVDETAVSQLFIRRNSSTSFTTGYIDTSMLSFNSTTVNFTATNVGTAIGFYADLRATTDVLGLLDNLQIIAPVLGDVDNSGTPDIADFNIIKTNLFKTGQTRLQGDLTNDAIVDFADFRQWKTAAGPGFASITLAGIPEPASAALLACGSFLLVLVRRRATQS